MTPKDLAAALRRLKPLVFETEEKAAEFVAKHPERAKEMVETPKAAAELRASAFDANNPPPPAPVAGPSASGEATPEQMAKLRTAYGEAAPANPTFAQAERLLSGAKTESKLRASAFDESNPSPPRGPIAAPGEAAESFGPRPQLGPAADRPEFGAPRRSLSDNYDASTDDLMTPWAPTATRVIPAGVGVGAGAAAFASGDSPRPSAPEPAAPSPGAAEVPPTTESESPAGGGATPATSTSASASTSPNAEPASAGPPRVGAVTRDFDAEYKARGYDKPVATITTPREFQEDYAARKDDLAKMRSDDTLDEDTRRAAGRLERELSAMKTEYEENKDRVAWFQLAEIFGNALAKIGAAQYGLKHGVDMSGTKFHYNDWEKMYDRLAVERGQRLTEARQQYATDSDTISAQRKSLEAARSRYDAARTAKTRADFDVERENAARIERREDDVARLHGDVSAQNASATQSANTTTAHLEASYDAEGRRARERGEDRADADRKRAEEKAEARQFATSKAALDSWQKKEDSFQEALRLLGAANAADSDKEAARLRFEAQQALGRSNADPEAVNRIFATHKESWLPWSSTDYERIQADLSRVPRARPPTEVDQNLSAVAPARPSAGARRKSPKDGKYYIEVSPGQYVLDKNQKD